MKKFSSIGLTGMKKMPPLIMKPAMPVSLSPTRSRKRGERSEGGGAEQTNRCASFILMMLTLPATALAEVDPYALSLEELMNTPVTVSSRKALSQRETPGIVTVITGEEILNSGARDLIDVLRQVPGIDFRVMVNNGLGLGMRGQIGSDGRVLMLVDGIEVNEHRYGSAVFGQGFPVEQIARIEIARGSSLALYGGAAELGVINITTKSAEELDGVHVGAGIGSTGSGTKSREYASLMAGKGGDGPVKWIAMAHLGNALRSDRTYQDVTGPSFSMAHANAVYLNTFNLGLQAGEFSARYLHDEPRFNDRDGPGYFVRAADASNSFNSDSLLLQYRHLANAQLTLTPNVLYQAQNPRKTVGANGKVSGETKVERLQTKLPMTWETGANWYFAAGLEYLDESYRAVVRSAQTGTLPFSRTTVASQYGEAMWNNPWGNLTASIRLDEHNHAGLLRAERLGYTKVMGDWHVKLTGSHATSAPSMEDYAIANRRGTSVKPETSRTWEMETGYRISSYSQLTLNLFDVTTFDTLILTNGLKVHTRGLEAGYKTRKDWGYADITYSYYNAAGTTTPEVRVIDHTPGAIPSVDSSINMAFPAHKLTANLHYNLSSGLSLNPSLVFLGPRWAYVAPVIDPVNYEATLKHFGATPLLNVVLRWENAGAKDLDLTLGLYNALNKEVAFIQPFDAGHAPLPAMSREVVLQAQYKF